LTRVIVPNEAAQRGCLRVGDQRSVDADDRTLRELVASDRSLRLSLDLYEIFTRWRRFFTRSRCRALDDGLVDWTNPARPLGLRHVRSQIRSHWGWAGLDREIAAGYPIDESEARRLRAQRLVYPAERHAIAAVLQNILDATESSSTGGRGIRPGDAAIIASQDRIVKLIELLGSDTPMTVRAVASAELLACDRHSPLVCPHAAEDIVQALDEVAAANAA
jgi:hypothetical protein